VIATAPPAVVDHHLNLVGQNVLTAASWGLTAVLLGATVVLGRRERTPFYFLVVLASMVAALAEPLYDEAFSLYFYSSHGMQTFYTAFDVPQPVWTHSGYAILYALPAVVLAYKIHAGRLSPIALYAWAGVEFTMSCVFEMTGINIGTYTYWGPHALRVFHYPLAIGALEAAQTICFALAVSYLRTRVTSRWQLLGLFVVFPVTFFGANFGAGSALIIVIHTANANRGVVYAATVVSIVFAAVLIRFAASLIPAGERPTPFEPQDPHHGGRAGSPGSLASTSLSNSQGSRR
jgi:hypothetical protein